MFSRPLIIFAALLWTISIFFLLKCRAVAQLHSTKGNKPLLCLTYSTPGLTAQKDFCFSQQQQITDLGSAALGINECLQVWARSHGKTAGDPGSPRVMP